MRGLAAIALGTLALVAGASAAVSPEGRITVGVSAAGATAPPQPQVAFKQFPGDGTAIVLLDQYGGNAVELTQGKPTASLSGAFSWAPDGSRLAYAGGAFLNSDIYTLGAGGQDLTRLTFDAGGSRVYDDDPAWSPDGTRIAYRKTSRVRLASGLYRLDDEIWIMDADGKNQHALTHDAGQKYSPRWSPDSARILYGRLSSAGKYAVYIVNAVSGNVAFVGRGDYGGTWSPDGTHFAVQNAHGIDVINADGTGRRTVVRDAGAPSWSPDGTRIAFTRGRSFQQDRYSSLVLSSVYVVGADGRGVRRLTGPLPGEKGSTRDGTPIDASRGAVWWPDGSRLFFTQQDQAHVMNADGSCEQLFGPQNLYLGEPAWRPGAPPSLAPIQCVALGVGATALQSEVGLRGTARFRIVIANDGNETASNVVLTLKLEFGRGQIRLVNPSCHRASPGVECDLAPVTPGRFVELLAAVTHPSPPVIHLQATVRASRPNSAIVTAAGLAQVGVPANCDIVGTPGHDTIVGTPRRDRICALAGADVIHAGAGDDAIQAGAGADTVVPGAGRDVVFGGEGPDRILVRDGERDVVDCGLKRDIVIADRIDRVARNCERVLYSSP